jgi:RND family efflux transporter MFP subunit
MKRGWRRVRRILLTLVVLSAVAAAGAGVYRYRMAQTALTLPVAPVRQGDFSVIIRCRGQLRAERSVTIYAPIVPQLRIAWLATAGESIKQGDTVVKFDSSTAQQQVLQKEAALQQAQAALDQYLAQARSTSDQDKTDLADAGFNVEKARLQASKTDIVSKIQSEEDKIDLGVSQQKEKAQQATVELHQAADRSKLASLTRLRDQAQSDLDLVKKRIGQMEIKAPISGYLTFLNNYSQGWVNAKEFKVGDNVGAGQPIGEIPDLNTLELDAKVEETDRGKIATEMPAQVHIDSLPELPLQAKVDSISPLAEQGFDFPPSRSFHAYAALAHPDNRLRPRMNGGLDIVVDRVKNAISIPAKALFTRDGKPIVYLANQGHYRPVEVQVLARNPDEMAISGVAAGSMVALADPTVKEKKK